MSLSTLRLSKHNIEQQITGCVREIGQRLPDMEGETNLKKTILYIHAIVFDCKKLGTFKLDFNGAGVDRYHLLSEKGKENLKKIDEDIEETVLSISQEIVDKLAWKQQIITIDHNEMNKRALSNRIIEVFSNPNENIQDLVIQCQIGQVFKIGNGTSTVVNLKKRENFNLVTILNSI